MPVHVRQAALEAVVVVAESFMIETHDVQNSGIKIIDLHWINESLRSEFITLAVAETLFHSGPCKEAGEGVGVVIATGSIPLKKRHASELGGPDDERIFE